MILAPWLALDDLNGTLIPSGHCSHTKTNDSYDNWFIVDLVHYVTISHVNILGRETRSLSVSKLEEFILFLIYNFYHASHLCLLKQNNKPE